jgi:hypothetical protein
MLSSGHPTRPELPILDGSAASHGCLVPKPKQLFTRDDGQEVSWLTIDWNRNPLHPLRESTRSSRRTSSWVAFDRYQNLAAPLGSTWLGKILAGFM